MMIIFYVFITYGIYYIHLYKPEIRIQYAKEEILKNLPVINIAPHDLYIHIRGGDFFRSAPAPMYAQPPLCFYEKII